jgi:polyhydroxyalkanoate synthase
MPAVQIETDEFTKAEERLRRMGKILTTRAAIAQTAKQQIWALNKTKLYRYYPLVPPEQRKKVPLLLVFALMNKPQILDLRPGHSFVEYMLKRGYDVFLLDWGSPGLEDKDLKFDDYALNYLPRAIRKMKSVSGSEEFSMLGWCIGAILTTLYSPLLSISRKKKTSRSLSGPTSATSMSKKSWPCSATCRRK